MHATWKRFSYNSTSFSSRVLISLRMEKLTQTNLGHFQFKLYHFYINGQVSVPSFDLFLSLLSSNLSSGGSKSRVVYHADFQGEEHSSSSLANHLGGFCSEEQPVSLVSGACFHYNHAAKSACPWFTSHSEASLSWPLQVHQPHFQSFLSPYCGHGNFPPLILKNYSKYHHIKISILTIFKCTIPWHYCSYPHWCTAITTIHFHTFFVIPDVLADYRGPFACTYQSPISHEPEPVRKKVRIYYLRSWSTPGVMGELRSKTWLLMASRGWVIQGGHHESWWPGELGSCFLLTVGH